MLRKTFLNACCTFVLIYFQTRFRLLQPEHQSADFWNLLDFVHIHLKSLFTWWNTQTLFSFPCEIVKINFTLSFWSSQVGPTNSSHTCCVNKHLPRDVLHFCCCDFLFGSQGTKKKKISFQTHTNFFFSIWATFFPLWLLTFIYSFLLCHRLCTEPSGRFPPLHACHVAALVWISGCKRLASRTDSWWSHGNSSERCT